MQLNTDRLVRVERTDDRPSGRALTIHVSDRAIGAKSGFRPALCLRLRNRCRRGVFILLIRCVVDTELARVAECRVQLPRRHMVRSGEAAAVLPVGGHRVEQIDLLGRRGVVAAVDHIVDRAVCLDGVGLDRLREGVGSAFCDRDTFGSKIPILSRKGSIVLCTGNSYSRDKRGRTLRAVRIRRLAADEG